MEPQLIVGQTVNVYKHTLQLTKSTTLYLFNHRHGALLHVVAANFHFLLFLHSECVHTQRATTLTQDTE